MIRNKTKQQQQQQQQKKWFAKMKTTKNVPVNLKNVYTVRKRKRNQISLMKIYLV